jgi:hypothetical protein
MSNIELNQQISECRSADEVLALVSRRGPEMNVVNCVTALQRIAKLPDGAASSNLIADRAQSLVPLLSCAAACFACVRPSKFDKPQPRHVAGALWACAKLQLPSEVCTLAMRAAVAAGAALNPAWYKPQELSMAVWALGKLASSNISSNSGGSSNINNNGGDVPATQCFVAALSLSAVGRSSAFDAQGLANLIQGAAAVGLPSDAFCPGGGGGIALAQKLAGCLVGRLATLSPQETANALAGLAKLEVTPLRPRHLPRLCSHNL